MGELVSKQGMFALEPRAEKSSGARLDLETEVSAIWICPEDEQDATEAFRSYVEAIAALDVRCELTAVINGDVGASSSLPTLLQTSDIPLRILKLHRKCDTSTALRSGLASSSGKYVVLLPPYLQTDPAAIGRMILELQRGSHYVASWRKRRIDSRWSALKSRVFNALTQSITGVPLHDINSGLRAMRNEVTEHLPIYGELQQFLPIMAAMQGYAVVEIEVSHLDEQVKKGDFRFGVYVRRILDLLTLFFLFKFTKKPLRFFGSIGAASLGVGGVAVLMVVLQRITGTAIADRPLLLLGVTCMVLGVQLVSLGLLGELIIFTHGRELLHQHVEELQRPND